MFGLKIPAPTTPASELEERPMAGLMGDESFVPLLIVFMDDEARRAS
jgi:hypothetical protein